MPSELHPEPRSAIDTVAVSEIGQAGVDGYLAVERIFVVIPVIAAAGADTAPGAVIGRGEVHTGDIGLVAIEELIIKVGDAIKIGAGQLAGTILPGILVIGGKSNPALEAVAAAKRHVGAERVGEVVDIDIGIGKLRLRRQGPALVKIDPLARLKAEGIAETIVAVGKAGAERIGGQITVIPGRLCLPVDIKTVLAIPCQRAAQSITVGVDRAITEERGNVGRGMAIMGGKTADELAGVALVELAVDAGCQLPGVDIVISVRGRSPWLELAMGTVNPCPDAARIGDGIAAF